jgi:hypothetical protein
MFSQHSGTARPVKATGASSRWWSISPSPGPQSSSRREQWL